MVEQAPETLAVGMVVDAAIAARYNRMAAAEETGWAVVLFTGSACEEHPGRPCIMEAFGPYASTDDATPVMEWYLRNAPWTAPHRVRLRPATASPP